MKRRRRGWRRPRQPAVPRLRGRKPAPFSRDPKQLPLPGLGPSPGNRPKPEPWPAQQKDLEDFLAETMQ
jgi:hypothetical protein